MRLAHAVVGSLAGPFLAVATAAAIGHAPAGLRLATATSTTVLAGATVTFDASPSQGAPQPLRVVRVRDRHLTGDDLLRIVAPLFASG